MLKLADDSLLDDVLRFSQAEPIGVRLACLASAYGLEGRMLSVWLQYDDSGRITAAFASYCSDCVLIASPGADACELALFVNSSSFRSLCASKKSFALCGLEPDDEKKLFCLENNAESFDDVKNEGDIRKMFELVCKSIPGSFEQTERAYLEFLSDYTYRKNRGLARLKVIERDDDPAAVCFTAAEDGHRALISAVAAKQDVRGMGFGKKIVLSMAAELQHEAKQPLVIALNKSAEGFYEHIGFKECGRICYIYKR